MAEFVRIEKVSHLRIFTHVIKICKFMISYCVYCFLWDNLNKIIPTFETSYNY